MLWTTNESAPHRIIMQVFEFLPHDGVAIDRLRMKSFLPDLICARPFVLSPKITELIEEPVSMFDFQLSEKATRGELLQVGDRAR